MATSIALYGGSFDPIHNGHLGIARSIADQLACERFLFLPAGTPPHKQDSNLASPEHRSTMIRLAIQDFPDFELNEYDLLRSGPSYTLETVQHFRESFTDANDIYWIIGADSLADLHSWYRIRDLAGACTLVTAGRPGWETPDLSNLQAMLSPELFSRITKHILQTPLFDISSTEIRNRCQQRQLIDHLVPTHVADYIRKLRLYR